MCCFDAGNATELGRERGEDAIYRFATDVGIRIARRSPGNSQKLGKGWSDWNERRVSQ